MAYIPNVIPSDIRRRLFVVENGAVTRGLGLLLPFSLRAVFFNDALKESRWVRSPVASLVPKSTNGTLQGYQVLK